MKKLLILSITAILLLCSVSLKAQTEKRTITPPKGSKVNLTIQNATVHIEGYDGDDIIFESYENSSSAKIPLVVTGLKDISTLTPNSIDNFYSWGGDILIKNSTAIFTAAGGRAITAVRLNGQTMGGSSNTIGILSGKGDTIRSVGNAITIANSPGVTISSGGATLIQSAGVIYGTAASTFARTTSKGIEGINPEMKETANGYTITLAFSSVREILIKVPRNIHLRLSSTSYSGNPETSIKNLTGEVEVTTSGANVLIDNVPGLASLSSRRLNNTPGKIVIKNSKWLEPQKTTTGATRPFAISAINSDIDITIPADLKATFTVDTPKGDLFSDLSLQKEEPVSTLVSAYSLISSSTLKNRFTGTLNGGGVSVSIRSEYGNVLLRKAK